MGGASLPKKTEGRREFPDPHSAGDSKIAICCHRRARPATHETAVQYTRVEGNVVRVLGGYEPPHERTVEDHDWIEVLHETVLLGPVVLETEAPARELFSDENLTVLRDMLMRRYELAILWHGGLRRRRKKLADDFDARLVAGIDATLI